MDPKELKALLKEAKDSIKSKDYATTVKNCKLVLKKVPENYEGNLYLGTALKEQGKWQQAIESFKKASEIDPNRVFAWQGIIVTYEKQGIKDHSDLLGAYKRVATFFEKDDDKSKYIESTKKLAHGLISKQDPKGALKVITRLSKSYGVDLEIAAMVEGLLNGTRFDNRTPDQNELYTQALKTIVTQSPKPSDETCKKYFTQLNKSGNHEEVVRQALMMREKWNFYSSPMDWLCRYYIEDRLGDKELEEIGSFKNLTDRLFKLHPSSSFGHFARGKFIIHEGLESNDGFSFISTGLESNKNFYALKILIRGRLDFGDFERAAEDCGNGLREFSAKEEYCTFLRLFFAESLIWLDVQKAEEILENIKDDVKREGHEENWILLRIQLYGKKLDFESLKKMIDIAETRKINHWLVNFYKAVLSVPDAANNRDKLKGAIDAQLTRDKAENFHLHLQACTFLFNLNFYKESAELLVELTSTPIGRRRPLPWKYLGKLYTAQDDTELAAKCYKKAYKLCPSAEVGALLSDSYFLLEKEDANIELLIGATKNFVKIKSKWAWLRLGILNLKNGEANDAVTALQAAIRSDINDCHVWESLADAYFLRGSYLAALNTYSKALSLGADHFYPKLKIGVVQQCLGQHDESVQTLTSLLDEFPGKCTPVLVELARSHSLIALTVTQENYDKTAKASVEASLAYSVLAILHSNEQILLPWKIIGESALTLNNLPEDSLIKVPKFLLGDNPQGVDLTKLKRVEDFEYVDVSLDRLREVAIHAMLECLRVVEGQENSSYSKNLRGYVYHQLGMLYFNRARSYALTEDFKKSADMYKKSMIAIKKAVAANQTQYIYWNTLGVIAYFTGNDQLAQHAFIKSLGLEGNNVVAWCNLGMLYLKYEKPLLAHKVFEKTQSLSPLHACSWIGQGLVAEQLMSKEAPDLFRHAAQLEPSIFAISSYADWICRILLKQVEFDSNDYWFCITRVDALTVVNDLITRVEVRNRTPQIYNMKGIMAALNGFYKTSLESFTTALELCKEQDNKNSPVSPSQLKQILLNRIVVLVKLQRFEEAVDAFATIDDLDQVGYAVGALTMSKLGYLEQSEKLYSQLLEHLPEDTAEQDRINVTIALGLVQNMHSGDEAACRLLLQDFMVQSPHGLLALSAIGIVNGDVDFVKNVMAHLEPFEQNEAVLSDIGLMKACFHIMNNDSKRGVNELLKLVHTNPQNAKLWSILSQILFRHEFQLVHPSIFQKITMTAFKLSSAKSKGRDDFMYSKSSAMISLCYLMNNDWKTAIKTAVKGIRKFPHERENWIVLACAFWYQFTETRDAAVYDKLIKILEKELSLRRIHIRAEEWASTFLQMVQKYRPSLK